MKRLALALALALVGSFLSVGVFAADPTPICVPQMPPTPWGPGCPPHVTDHAAVSHSAVSPLPSGSKK